MWLYLDNNILISWIRKSDSGSYRPAQHTRQPPKYNTWKTWVLEKARNTSCSLSKGNRVLTALARVNQEKCTGSLLAQELYEIESIMKLEGRHEKDEELLDQWRHQDASVQMKCIQCWRCSTRNESWQWNWAFSSSNWRNKIFNDPGQTTRNHFWVHAALEA